MDLNLQPTFHFGEAGSIHTSGIDKNQFEKQKGKKVPCKHLIQTTHSASLCPVLFGCFFSQHCLLFFWFKCNKCSAIAATFFWPAVCWVWKHLQSLSKRTHQFCSPFQFFPYVILNIPKNAIVHFKFLLESGWKELKINENCL